jgi:2-polyprenyl-6-methoxyphenol hydroxylase-like FAD-dependent oxidoreductase
VPRSVLDAAASAPRIEATFGQSGFFGYGFCSPEPDQGAMWWSTQPSNGIGAATFRTMDQQALKQHLRDFHAGWHDPIPRIIDVAENIGVTDNLDVATLPIWSRGRTVLIGDAAHATSPHAGQGASLALEDALRLTRLLQQGHELRRTFENFEAERRSRAERIVALARRNGNSKRELTAVSAWIRDWMLKIVIPFTSKGMDWIYAYDPAALTPPPQSSGRRYRQAA